MEYGRKTQLLRLPWCHRSVAVLPLVCACVFNCLRILHTLKRKLKQKEVLVCPFCEHLRVKSDFNTILQFVVAKVTNIDSRLLYDDDALNDKALDEMYREVSKVFFSFFRTVLIASQRSRYYSILSWEIFLFLSCSMEFLVSSRGTSSLSFCMTECRLHLYHFLPQKFIPMRFILRCITL